MIGHNPGMHELALELAGPAQELAGKLRTAALATLAFHGSTWDELEPEATELVEPPPALCDFGLSGIH
jgi:phosphohistidine phosphatase SixA